MRLSTLALLATTSLTLYACGEQRGGAPREERVEPAKLSVECPPDWPGPWTACPEAEWVQRVAERAGYRVTGETGSALIAQGKGQSFYIWGLAATEDEIDRAKREDWRPLGLVEGVVVYGDDDLWRWWEVDEFILWVQAGPYEDSWPPSLDEMDALVEASSMVP
jgi:hypothetical protein